MPEDGPARSILSKIAIGLLGLLLAALAAVNAASNVWAEERPILAARLWPYAAEANERLATLAQQVAQDVDGNPVIDVSAAAPFALAAFEIDPLSGAALSVLAREQDDDAGRHAVLDAASRVTRRAPLLQAALLERHVSAGDFDAALDTLDRTLKVYPQFTYQIMPLFVDALQEEKQVRRFEQILQRDPIWESDFFRFASGTPELTETLGRLRIAQGEEPAINRQTDHGIIRRLLAADDYAKALRVYQLAGGREVPPDSGRWDLGWTQDLPPFDWALQDSPGEYARIARDGGLLISLRRGKGGELARRNFVRPGGIRSITIEHDIGPSIRLRDMEVSLICENNLEIYSERPFSTSPIHIDTSVPPGSCGLYRLTISGRAWSTGDEVGGTINRIVID